jgi:hypothetical protein
MYGLKYCAARFILVMGLVCGVSACVENHAAAQVSRTIKFAEEKDGGGNNCRVPADTDQTIWLNKEDYGCKNDEMSYFQLENVRSAVWITLESRDCNDSGGWVFKLETYIDPLTTPFISIPDLKGHAPGHIVTAGVVLVESRNEDEDSLVGKLSCVYIDVSD